MKKRQNPNYFLFKTTTINRTTCKPSNSKASVDLGDPVGRSVLGAEMLVDFVHSHTDHQAVDQELLLLRQPHQLHPHLAVGVLVLHQEVVAAVVTGLRLRHAGADGGAEAPEGFLMDVQEGQSQEAAVLRHRWRRGGTLSFNTLPETEE